MLGVGVWVIVLIRLSTLTDFRDKQGCVLQIFTVCVVMEFRKFCFRRAERVRIFFDSNRLQERIFFSFSFPRVEKASTYLIFLYNLIIHRLALSWKIKMGTQKIRCEINKWNPSIRNLSNMNNGELIPSKINLLPVYSISFSEPYCGPSEMHDWLTGWLISGCLGSFK